MKKLFFVFWLPMTLAACKKEKSPTRAKSYYHISGSDTLSALHVPGSFTPNGDGTNDLFRATPIGCDSAHFKMQIRNRNTLVFSTVSMLNGWDGTYGGIQSASGKYVYTIDAGDYSGYAYHVEGEVLLVR